MKKRIYWKEGKRQIGFYQGAIYDIVKETETTLEFKGYWLIHNKADIKRMEDITQ